MISSGRFRRYGLASALATLAVSASCSSNHEAGRSDASTDGRSDRDDKADVVVHPTDAGHDAKKPPTSDGCGMCDPTNDGGKDGAGGGSSSANDSGQDSAKAPMGAHTAGVSIAVPTQTGTVMRTYSITLPASCDSSNPLPLVFAFHGDGGNGEGMYESFPIEAAAAAAGGQAIFVYPDGTNQNIDPDGTPRAWDLYHDPGYLELDSSGAPEANPYAYTPGQPVPAVSDEASGNEDVDFFDAMVEFFEKTYCVDQNRVFITGMSSGGYLANQFARWRATVVKGTAPQSGGAPFGNNDGVQGSDSDPTASDWVGPNYCVGTTGAVPAIIIHGLSDGTVLPCNAIEAQSYWELANSCSDSANNCTTSADSCTGSNLADPSPAPTSASSLNSDCVETQGCGSAPVVLCQVPGLGHAIWSDAPAVIWGFFASL